MAVMCSTATPASYIQKYTLVYGMELNVSALLYPLMQQNLSEYRRFARASQARKKPFQYSNISIVRAQRNNKISEPSLIFCDIRIIIYFKLPKIFSHTNLTCLAFSIVYSHDLYTVLNIIRTKYKFTPLV